MQGLKRLGVMGVILPGLHHDTVAPAFDNGKYTWQVVKVIWVHTMACSLAQCPQTGTVILTTTPSFQTCSLNILSIYLGLLCIVFQSLGLSIYCAMELLWFMNYGVYQTSCLTLQNTYGTIVQKSSVSTHIMFQP